MNVVIQTIKEFFFASSYCYEYCYHCRINSFSSKSYPLPQIEFLNSLRNCWNTKTVSLDFVEE